MDTVSWLLLILWAVSVVITLPTKSAGEIAFDVVMFSSAVYVLKNLDGFTIPLFRPLPFDRLSSVSTVPQVIHVSGKKLKSKNAGYVYLLKELNGTNYKIGRTHDPRDRLKTFNVKLPFPVAYTCLIACEDMYALESALHGKFASKRVNGEWFALDTIDVEYIQSLAQDA